MGHSTSSGRTTAEPARQSLTNPAPPRYELALDLRAEVPQIVRNMTDGQRLTVTNDYSDLDITKVGENEYRVRYQWQNQQNDRYTVENETTTMNRGQVSKRVKRELNERSTVRLGNETLYRRPRR